jgi:hypothetical protein
MYNAPGADWTAEERAALKRFLKARGGQYREKLPAAPGRRLRHMKRQPYVMREEEAPTRVASSPLSIREAAAEVIPFPSEKVTPAEEQEKPADILAPKLEHGSFGVFVKGYPVGWYDRAHSAIKAAKDMAEAFVSGQPSLPGEAVREDAQYIHELGDWMETTGRDYTEPVDIFLHDPRFRESRDRLAKMILTVLPIPGEPPSPDQRSEGTPDPHEEFGAFEERFPQLAEHQDKLNWERISASTDTANDEIRAFIVKVLWDE